MTKEHLVCPDCGKRMVLTMQHIPADLVRRLAEGRVPPSGPVNMVVNVHATEAASSEAARRVAALIREQIRVRPGSLSHGCFAQR